MLVEIPQNKDQLVAIAKVVRVRGIHGEVLADILTDFPERFSNTKRVFLLSPEGKIEPLQVEHSWFHKDRIVLKFSGIDSIESAKRIVNCEVCVPESETVQLDEDEFFDWQLIGCSVETVDREKIGEVVDIMRTGGTEILVVDGLQKDYLIPFANSICIEVNIQEKLIRVDAPEGLLEF